MSQLVEDDSDIHDRIDLLTYRLNENEKLSMATGDIVSGLIDVITAQRKLVQQLINNITIQNTNQKRLLYSFQPRQLFFGLDNSQKDLFLASLHSQILC